MPAPAVARAASVKDGDEQTVEEKEVAARDIAATLAEPGWGVTYAPPRNAACDRGW